MTDTQNFSIAKTSETDVQGYLSAITSSWRRASHSILEAAISLQSARQNLSAKEFAQLRRQLQDDGVMPYSTISKLLKIADNSKLHSPERMNLLPPSYETIYEISRFDDDQLDAAFESGKITPDLSRNELKTLKGETSSSTNTTTSPDRVVIQAIALSDLSEKSKQELNEIYQKLMNMTDLKVTKFKV